MAEEISSAGWETDLEQFMADLFEAKRTLDKGYWCMDSDIKYLNVRIDTRDLGYILSADGRGHSSNMGNKFRISPNAVRAAISAWRDKFHSKRKAAKKDGE